MAAFSEAQIRAAERRINDPRQRRAAPAWEALSCRPCPTPAVDRRPPPLALLDLRAGFAFRGTSRQVCAAAEDIIEVIRATLKEPICDDGDVDMYDYYLNDDPIRRPAIMRTSESRGPVVFLSMASREAGPRRLACPSDSNTLAFPSHAK